MIIRIQEFMIFHLTNDGFSKGFLFLFKEEAMEEGMKEEQSKVYLITINGIIVLGPVVLFKKILLIYLERREGKEKDRERNISVWLPLATCPTTQACALTGNRTGDPLVCSLALNPLSHTSQG